tara:strand:- start:475 stop:885 length:411 start_codon:yes stop_codon:yes gene_type:complete
MREWLQVKNLEMLVSKSELNLDINKNSDVLLFSCDLLNIARGRCDLVLKKTLNSSISYISIKMDKPVMEGEINFSKEKFENILDSIAKFLSKNNSKKLKIILFLNKPLAVNNHGVLSIEQNIKLEIINLKLIFPII